MPTIYDLFGYNVNDRTPAIEASRKAKRCPFTDADCDGGGNRYQTKIMLTPAEPLTRYFNPGITDVVPGVCSIQAGNDVWVVCPRRILGAKHNGIGPPPVNRALQQYESDLLKNAGLPLGIDVGLWTEVNLDFADINYHFDYVAAPLRTTTLRQEAQLYNATNDDLRLLVQYAKASRYFVPRQPQPEDVPILLPDLTRPYILEVMSASTSGSNRTMGTDIQSAFRNAILTPQHQSPGINKRQVWGRMATQLFAKTALAEAWSGEAVWIIQDELLKDIERTTRLKTGGVKTNPGRNIKFIVMHYALPNTTSTFKEVSFRNMVEGDAGIDFSGSDTYTDILLPSSTPPKIELLKSIVRCPLAGIVNL